MFLSKVTLNKGPKLFELLRKKSGTDGYASHQLLWDLFPNDGDKKRDFIFHKEDKQGLPTFFVMSQEKPVQTDALSVQTKPFLPKLSIGQKLAFTLVANPIVARKKDGQKNSVKHDVWMNAKKEAQEKGVSEQKITQHCEEAAKQWLIHQSEQHGFSITKEVILIDGYQPHRLYKKNSKKPIRFSTIHYQGILTITDPDTFVEMLGKGLGKSKAFGCGLMLVRRT